MIVECPGCRSRYDLTGRPPGTQARCRCGRAFLLPAPSREAGQLSCPGCGAKVPPAGARCAHCDTPLLRKACPRCFARIFHGARHCDQCGATVVAPASADPEGRPTARACPRCAGAALVARLVGETVLDECPTCHGVWLDVAAVEQIVRERKGAAPVALAGLGVTPPSVAEPAGALGPAGYVRCPDCESLMNRRNFGRRSGVVVDVCSPHGTWFDADELPRVVAFVTRGGLEEAERKELERLREETRMRRVDSTAGGAAASGARADGGFHDGSFYAELVAAVADLLTPRS